MTRRNLAGLFLLLFSFTSVAVTAQADDASPVSVSHPAKKKSHSHKKSKKNKKSRGKRSSPSSKMGKRKSHSPQVTNAAQEPGTPLPPPQVPKE